MTIKYHQWYKWTVNSKSNPSLLFIYYFCPHPRTKETEPYGKIWEENSYEGTLIRFITENNSLVALNIQKNTSLGIPGETSLKHTQSISKEKVMQDFLNMQSFIYHDLF